MTTASAGVAMSGPGSPAGIRLEGQVSGLTVPMPQGPSIDINPIPPPYSPDRGFTPLPPGLNGPLITVPGPQVGGTQDGPGSSQRTPVPPVVIDRNPGAAGSGNPITGAKPNQGRFPPTAEPNDILVNRGNDGKVNSYAVYGLDGRPVKRVDVRGRSHGGIPTPHVQEFDRNVHPVTGEVFVNPGQFREATPDEVAGLL